MAKRIVVKVGTYQKDGKEKGEYVKVGVILSNENGEFILLDPTINMAGLLLKQQVNGIAKAGSDSVIASIFTDEQNQRPTQQSQNTPNVNKDLPSATPTSSDLDYIPFMQYEYKAIV